jgi:hypothetical protein
MQNDIQSHNQRAAAVGSLSYYREPNAWLTVGVKRQGLALDPPLAAGAL